VAVRELGDQKGAGAMMETKFMHGLVIWVAELVDDYGTTKEPTRVFVNAANLVAAHDKALRWGRETMGFALVRSVKLVADCVLDGSVE